MRRLSVSVYAAVVALAIGTRTVQAEEDTEALIRQGNALRAQGDKVRAYGYFKRAYDMAHTPRTAAQLGLIEQSLERFRFSEAHLSEALAAADPWVDENRPRLEEMRDRARARLGRIDFRGAIPGTTVAMIDGEQPRVVPRDGSVWVDPGVSNVRITIPGRTPFLKTVSLTAGATVTIELPAKIDSPPALEAPPPTPPVGPASPIVIAAPAPHDSDPAADSAGAKRLAGIIVASAGIALSATGVFTYLAGAKKLETINSAASRHDVYDPSDGNWRTLAYGGMTMVAVGAATAAAGTILYLLNRKTTGAEAGSATPGLGLSYHPNGIWLTTLGATF